MLSAAKIIANTSPEPALDSLDVGAAREYFRQLFVALSRLIPIR